MDYHKLAAVLTAFILLGMFVALGSFIQSAGAFWGAFTHYFTITRNLNP
jgi:hypothetical protein